PNGVRAVAFSPDGRLALTAGGLEKNGGGVHLWEAATGRPVGKPLAHGRTVHAASFSPDGRTVLALSMDAALLWDVAAARLLGGVPHHSFIWPVAFSPAGRFFGTASKDGTAAVWDTASRALVFEVRHHGGVQVVAVSPDGRTLLTGSEDKTAQLWDAR